MNGFLALLSPAVAIGRPWREGRLFWFGTFWGRVRHGFHHRGRHRRGMGSRHVRHCRHLPGCDDRVRRRHLPPCRRSAFGILEGGYGGGCGLSRGWCRGARRGVSWSTRVCLLPRWTSGFISIAMNLAYVSSAVSCLGVAASLATWWLRRRATQQRAQRRGGARSITPALGMTTKRTNCRC